MDFKMTKQTQVRSIEEALKLALEALTHFEKAGLATLKTVDAITTIREALAEHPAQTDWEAVAADQAMTIALLRAEQPAQQEPVAVVSGYYGGQCVILPIDPARIFNSNTALYTSAPQRKPLTDEEIYKLCRNEGDEHSTCFIFNKDGIWSVLTLARAIEAKLKAKNSP